MSNKSDRDSKQLADDFARQAQTRQPGIISETVSWLRNNKKWWFLPVIITLLFIGMLVVLGGSPLAPFIYTLF